MHLAVGKARWEVNVERACRPRGLGLTDVTPARWANPHYLFTVNLNVDDVLIAFSDPPRKTYAAEPLHAARRREGGTTDRERVHDNWFANPDPRIGDARLDNLRVVQHLRIKREAE